MSRCLLTVLALVLSPWVAQAQNGFWYPNCASGQCAPVPACAPCAAASSVVAVPRAADSPDSAAPAGMVAVPKSESLPAPSAAIAPPAPAAAESGQASPSDAGAGTANDELETLRRELERLKLRNQEFEKSLAAVQAAVASQDQNVQQQLKSIFESVAKLRPADAQGPEAAAIRELQTLVEKLPQLIDESVRLRIQELRSGNGDKLPTP